MTKVYIFKEKNMRNTLTFILAALIIAVISSCNGTKKTTGPKTYVMGGNKTQQATDKPAEMLPEKIIKIAAAKARNKQATVTYTSTFDELGFDELAKEEFIMEVAQALHITIPDDAAKNINSVQQTIAFAQTHQARQ